MQEFKDLNDIQMLPIMQPQPSVYMCYCSNVIILQVQKYTHTDGWLQALHLNSLEIKSLNDADAIESSTGHTENGSG